MRIHIVIPVHNRKDMTRDCLSSLQEQSERGFQTIVVDDGSTDGTSEMIKREFPDVVLLHGDGNLWWVGAINKGIRYALDVCDPDDSILVLNDDLVVPEDYIAAFRRVASAHPNTLIGSVVADIDNRDVVRKGGVTIDWRTARRKRLNEGRPLSSFPKGFSVEVSTLTGRGVLIPAEGFRKIGLYDEKHFLQCGDTELPVRAARAGYKLIVSYDAVVFGYAEDRGNINHMQRYRLSDAWNYFWDVRSHCYLPDRFWFALSASRGTLRGIRYFAFDLARVIFHFVVRLELR